MDRVNKSKRSYIMSCVKSRHTSPEILIRKELHKIGLRYRLHDKNLPGKPDLVFPKYKAVVFVNGCFWHGHKCSKGRLPKSNLVFWREKVERNRKRDSQNARSLRRLGYKVLVVWQCSIMGRRKIEIRALGEKVRRWLCSKGIAGR
ncbi:MAG: DNA mismatch endonuclease Vsr [Nitrospinae bacterium]|nr:DNA mismatch endonuclease Vsr [Nitrospinota bacterium]